MACACMDVLFVDLRYKTHSEIQDVPRRVSEKERFHPSSGIIFSIGYKMPKYIIIQCIGDTLLYSAA